MSLPPVEHARTPDGRTIAYGVRSSGQDVLALPFHHNHYEWRWQRWAWIGGLADHFRVTHYDSRGQGLSSRGLTDHLSVEDYRTDLDAIVAAAGLERFSVVAYGGFAHVALRYAADHPEQVRAIVLICTCESFTSWPVTGMLALAEENWDLFLEFETARTSDENRPALIGAFKAGTTQQDYIRMVRAFSSSTITDLIGRVEAPTLMLHSLGQHWLSVDEGSRLAASLGARLVLLDGSVEPDAVQGVRAIREFLDALPVDSGGASSRPDDWWSGLTSRQQEVLRLLAGGRTTREIAAELVVSERTVERHIADVYSRIGVRNRVEATNAAREVLRAQQT